jgi:hypothetical protein
VGRAVGIVTDEAVSGNTIAVGRGAHGKRGSSHVGEFAVMNKQQKSSVPGNVIISTQTTNLLSTPTSNHETSFKEVFLTTPVTNNDTAFEEEQVCWLCGGTPCDWLEYLAELLEEINEKFPKDADGNRIDTSSHEQKSICLISCIHLCMIWAY